MDLGLESVVVFGLVLHHDRHCLAGTLDRKDTVGFNFKVLRAE